MGVETATKGGKRGVSSSFLFLFSETPFPSINPPEGTGMGMEKTKEERMTNFNLLYYYYVSSEAPVHFQPKKKKKKETTNKDSLITVYNAERSGAYIVNYLH